MAFDTVQELDELLIGAVDMHIHGYPDVGFEYKLRTSDFEMVQAARDWGMRGIVLKSHLWPTMDRAYQLTERLNDPSFLVLSSITLNPVVGGVSPLAVEAAAAHGARVVHMPTWGALNDHSRGGFVRRNVMDPLLPSVRPYLDQHAFRALDGNGRLQPEVKSVLDAVRDLGMVLFTGHLSPEETVAIAEAAKDTRLDRLVFCHPLSHSVGADKATIEQVAELGAYIEFPQAHTVRPSEPVVVADAYEIMQSVGLDRCVLTSDFFSAWLPTAPETLRMYLGQLRQLGVSRESIRTMVAVNPARLLQLEDPAPSGTPQQRQEPGAD